MKVLPYFHGHFGPLINSLISSSIGDDIVPLVAVHATRALNNHPINSTIFFTCNLRFSNTDPDTMTLDKAMKQPDGEEFVKAMEKELMDHIERKHWKVVPMRSIPKQKK